MRRKYKSDQVSRGWLFEGTAPPGVSEAKFDSCVAQVKISSPGVNPWAVCTVALRGR